MIGARIARFRAINLGEIKAKGLGSLSDPAT
jgi:hypothetical protein